MSDIRALALQAVIQSEPYGAFLSAEDQQRIADRVLVAVVKEVVRYRPRHRPDCASLRKGDTYACGCAWGRYQGSFGAAFIARKNGCEIADHQVDGVLLKAGPCSCGLDAILSVLQEEGSPEKDKKDLSRSDQPQLRACESDPRGDLRGVSMPPPIAQDWQVSPVDGPDYDPQQFTGGVEKIERKNGLLVIYFVAGGQVSVNHGVTYVSPERH